MPITPKEIMKGCIVCYDGKPRLIKAISELIMLEGDKNWIGASLMNGEPISETWLQRFGFLEQDDGGFFRQLDMQNIGILITPSYPKDPHGWLAFRGFINSWGELRPLEYCHQLQILFFSITGEHLPIPKLPK